MRVPPEKMRSRELRPVARTNNPREPSWSEAEAFYSIPSPVDRFSNARELTDVGAAILRAVHDGQFNPKNRKEEGPELVPVWTGNLGDVLNHEWWPPVRPWTIILENDQVKPPKRELCKTKIPGDFGYFPHWHHLPCPCGRVIWRLR